MIQSIRVVGESRVGERKPRLEKLSITEVIAQFLDEQRDRLAPKTFAQYRSVVQLLQHCINGYGSQRLDQPDSKLFDQLYNAKGDAHREFCDVFGPEHILPNVGEFLDYFMVRKVIAGKDLMRAAGTVTKRLAKWLGEKGHVGSDEAGVASERGGRAARDLPRAGALAALLRDFAEGQERGNEEKEVEDHFLVARVEKGRIWLDGIQDGRSFGPIAVPEEISSRCKVSWTISGVVGRTGKRWQLVEAWNVYPG